MSIDYEKFWSSGNSQNLLSLAKDIESQDAWRGFLTIQEHGVFKYALEKGGDIWTEFINGNVICRLEQESLSGSKQNQTTSSKDSNIPDAKSANDSTPKPTEPNNFESTNGENGSNDPTNSEKKFNDWLILIP